MLWLGSLLPGQGQPQPAPQQAAPQQPGAQQPAQPQGPQRAPAQGDEGKIIRAIHYKGATNVETIRRFMRTKAGRPLSADDVSQDMHDLWRQLRYIVTQVWVQDAEDGGVIVTFVIDEPDSYDRVEFKGLDAFTEKDVRDLLELTSSHRLTDVAAEDKKRILEQRYHHDGYYWAQVTLEPNEETSTLTFAIDEGPKMRVRHVRFVGNRSFPSDVPYHLGRDLEDGADLKMTPGVLWGDPYSDEELANDLDRLRRFYRSHGYRDAQIELEERSIVENGTQVDLTYRVVEGPQYVVRSVDIVRYDKDGKVDAHPLYDKDLILSKLLAKPGEFYDRDVITRDKAAIEEFYGERGHPLQFRYGEKPIPDAFQWVEPSWLQPRETFHPDTAEIDLVYEVIEGTPKTVHDVQILGNEETQDEVVRREVRVFPGQPLDVREAQRSVRRLTSLRYFQDPQTLQGPRFHLDPVEGSPDQVDVVFDVTEGDTGSFLWGAGVSTGLGVQGQFQFTKRNFDLFRLPSSFNPATIVDEVVNGRAFQGAGQELQLSLAPGTELSTFQLSFDEPDLFGDHLDTVGLRVQGYRRIRVLDTFDSDTLGGIVQLSHNFSDELRGSVQFREETVDVSNLDPNAPLLVFDAEGSTELRSVRFAAGHRDLDYLLQPTTGHDFVATAEVGGGPLGGGADFWSLGLSTGFYWPLYHDTSDHVHVLHLSQSFDYGSAYGSDKDLFVTERYYMGGSNLRGFDQRGAGPTQFGQPLGGEVRWLGSAEYQFPLFSGPRAEGALTATELLRGVVFVDAGMLGTGLDDPTFTQPRLSVGVGVRIHVPVLGVPIALDFGFPVLYEKTDNTQLLYFSLARN